MKKVSYDDFSDITRGLEVTKGKHRIQILHDDTGANDPREWDNLGEMVCFHSRYELGDTHNYSSPEDFKESIKKGDIVLPIYMYDHSGIGISTSNDRYPFNCPWDSGQLGVIVARKKSILECYKRKKITKKLRDKVIAQLKQEVKTYNQFISGDVYGYSIDKSKICDKCGDMQWENVDSCWGYFGVEETIEAVNEVIEGI